MLLESWELKENGLKREYDEVAGKVKFFAINPPPVIDAIAPIPAALPIEKALPDKVSSDAIATKSKITYRFNPDGSIILRSLKGISLESLKHLSDEQLEAIGLYREQIGINTKYFEIQEDGRDHKVKQAKSIATIAVLSRPEALRLAQSKGFAGTAQNLYDWAKAALNGKSDQSRESNIKKLAEVGLKAISNDGVTAWQALTP